MKTNKSSTKFTICVFLVSVLTAFAEITLKVFAKPENREFPEGYEIISTPSETASLIKTMPSGSATIAGYTDVNGKRYFISEWSYERYKTGQSYNWIRPKEAAKQEPRKYAALTELIRKQQVEEEQSRVVSMPNQIKGSVKEIVNGVRDPKPVLGGEYQAFKKNLGEPWWSNEETSDDKINDSLYRISVRYKQSFEDDFYFLDSLPKPKDITELIKKINAATCIGANFTASPGDLGVVLKKINLDQKYPNEWTKEETATFEKTCNDFALQNFSKSASSCLLENLMWVRVESKNPKLIRYDSSPDNRYTLLSEIMFVGDTRRILGFKASAFDRNYMNAQQSKKLESTK